MRTVCGIARLLATAGGATLRRRGPAPVIAPARPAHRPLLAGTLGEQRRAGVRLDQVDGTTCGSAVLVALAAWADPAELTRLDGDTGPVLVEVPGAATGVAAGFGERFDARQKQVHGQTNRFWPQALGTLPWSMVRWLRRHAPAAGAYRVRLVDDVAAGDVTDLVAAVDAALAAGRPVPLLVGTVVPRHYVLVLGAHPGHGWRVYEPTGGAVRVLDPALVGRRALRPVLGFDRLHAALLPV